MARPWCSHKGHGDAPHHGLRASDTVGECGTAAADACEVPFVLVRKGSWNAASKRGSIVVWELLMKRDLYLLGKSEMASTRPLYRRGRCVRARACVCVSVLKAVRISYQA